MESISSVLPGLTGSLESAVPALPTTVSILPPSNGITLLDAKNELFLSYLQTLALRNLAVIRSAKDKTPVGDLDGQLVKDLVKYRVYLEKGVRPLEDRLKYQIDKVVRAAEDEARGEAQKTAVKERAVTRQAGDRDDDDDDNDDGDSDAADSDVDELAYRPNPNAFGRPAAAAAHTQDKPAAPSDGIYRPPRITATAMPTTEPRREKSVRPLKSNTLDEFVADELSGAPSAQPSIGSTITAGGRRDKSARERAKEAERTAYEESNLVRLPKEGKKERAKNARNQRGGFGGEDWDMLGQGVARIDRLTNRKSGGGVGGALERSRKRKVDEDGPRGSADMGREFERRKKRAMRKN